MSSKNTVPAWANKWKDTEESRDWYYWQKEAGNRKWGAIQYHARCGVGYTLLSLLPVVFYCFNPQWMHDLFLSAPLIPIGWVIFLALTYPLFVWKEAIEFEIWFAKYVADADNLKADTANTSSAVEGEKKIRALKEQQRWFYQNAKYVEGFWKTLGGIYAAVGLLALMQKDPPDQKAKDASMASAIESTGKALAGAAQKIEEAKKAVGDIKRNFDRRQEMIARQKQDVSKAGEAGDSSPKVKTATENPSAK